MEQYLQKFMVGYVKKEHLYNQLRDQLMAITATAIEQNKDAAYAIGYHFGQVDTLKQIIDLLEQIPQEEPPQKEPARAWHQK